MRGGRGRKRERERGGGKDKAEGDERGREVERRRGGGNVMLTLNKNSDLRMPTPRLCVCV